VLADVENLKDKPRVWG